MLLRAAIYRYLFARVMVDFGSHDALPYLLTNSGGVLNNTHRVDGARGVQKCTTPKG